MRTSRSTLNRGQTLLVVSSDIYLYSGILTNLSLHSVFITEGSYSYHSSSEYVFVHHLLCLTLYKTTTGVAK